MMMNDSIQRGDTADQLVDERRHQPRFFGHARAHHGDEDDGHHAEAGEVGHKRGEDEANTLGGEQAANGNRLLLNLEFGVVGFFGQSFERFSRISHRNKVSTPG
jgi:hypothetical protein